MYDIYMRCYPQPDINITEEWELMPFTRLDRANAFIESLEKDYASEDWKGHRMYKAKFYAMERYVFCQDQEDACREQE